SFLRVSYLRSFVLARAPRHDPALVHDDRHAALAAGPHAVWVGRVQAGWTCFVLRHHRTSSRCAALNWAAVSFVIASTSNPHRQWTTKSVPPKSALLGVTDTLCCVAFIARIIALP